jgi:two-component system NarL family sensor kinase
MAGVVIHFIIRYQKKVLFQQKELKNTEIKFLKKMTDAVLVKVEEERNKISENLHDDVGTMLSLIKLNQQRLFKTLVETPENKEVIDINNKLVNNIVKKIKLISDDLVNPTLRLFGFKEAVEELCISIHSTKQVSVKYRDESKKHDLEKSTEVQMLRICSELLNNLIKHSLPKNVDVNMRDVENTLVVTIKHDGKGIDDQQVVEFMKDGSGLGLKNIFSRAQMINAKIEYNNDLPEAPFVKVKLILTSPANPHEN